jgi:hypothetical protein
LRVLDAVVAVARGSGRCGPRRLLFVHAIMAGKGKGKGIFGSPPQSSTGEGLARGSVAKVVFNMPAVVGVADTPDIGQSGDSATARMRSQLEHACADLRARDEEVDSLNATVDQVRVVFLGVVVGWVGHCVPWLTRSVSCMSQLRATLVAERQEWQDRANARTLQVEQLVCRAWTSRGYCRVAYGVGRAIAASDDRNALCCAVA